MHTFVHVDLLINMAQENITLFVNTTIQNLLKRALTFLFHTASVTTNLLKPVYIITT